MSLPVSGNRFVAKHNKTKGPERAGYISIGFQPDGLRGYFLRQLTSSERAKDNSPG